MYALQRITSSKRVSPHGLGCAFLAQLTIYR